MKWVLNPTDKIKFYMKGCGSAGEKWGVVNSFNNRKQQRNLLTIIWLMKLGNCEM